MEFCKTFNDKTKKDFMGKPVPVVITVYKDKKFDFVLKTPPASFYIKQAAKLKSGSKEPGRIISGSITKKQAEQIAKEKMKDLNAFDLAEATKIICGSARSITPPSAVWSWKVRGQLLVEGPAGCWSTGRWLSTVT